MYSERAHWPLNRRHCSPPLCLRRKEEENSKARYQPNKDKIRTRGAAGSFATFALPECRRANSPRFSNSATMSLKLCLAGDTKAAAEFEPHWMHGSAIRPSRVDHIFLVPLALARVAAILTRHEETSALVFPLRRARHCESLAKPKLAPAVTACGSLAHSNTLISQASEKKTKSSKA